MRKRLLLQAQQKALQVQLQGSHEILSEDYYTYLVTPGIAMG